MGCCFSAIQHTTSRRGRYSAITRYQHLSPENGQNSLRREGFARASSVRTGAVGRTERLPRRGLASALLIAPEAGQSGRASALPKMPVQFRPLHVVCEVHLASRRSRYLLSVARFRADGEPRSEEF